MTARTIAAGVVLALSLHGASARAAGEAREPSRSAKAPESSRAATPAKTAAKAQKAKASKRAPSRYRGNDLELQLG
jgi:hypothetical protein